MPKLDQLPHEIAVLIYQHLTAPGAVLDLTIAIPSFYRLFQNAPLVSFQPLLRLSGNYVRQQVIEYANALSVYHGASQSDEGTFEISKNSLSAPLRSSTIPYPLRQLSSFAKSITIVSRISANCLNSYFEWMQSTCCSVGLIRKDKLLSNGRPFTKYEETRVKRAFWRIFLFDSLLAASHHYQSGYEIWLHFSTSYCMALPEWELEELQAAYDWIKWYEAFHDRSGEVAIHGADAFLRRVKHAHYFVPEFTRKDPGFQEGTKSLGIDHPNATALARSIVKSCTRFTPTVSSHPTAAWCFQVFYSLMGEQDTLPLSRTLRRCGLTILDDWRLSRAGLLPAKSRSLIWILGQFPSGYPWTTEHDEAYMAWDERARLAEHCDHLRLTIARNEGLLDAEFDDAIAQKQTYDPVNAVLRDSWFDNLSYSIDFEFDDEPV